MIYDVPVNTPRRIFRWGIGLLAGIVLIGVLGALLLILPTRRPCRFILPDGFRGKVVIQFAIPNAPPAPIENGYFVFRLPKSGRMDTSDDLEEGAARDQYFFETKTGLVEIPDPPFPEERVVAMRGGSIGSWQEGKTNSQGQSETTYTSPTNFIFYVGTEKDYRQALSRP